MSGHFLSHSNSFGFEMEKDEAGYRALNRNFIVGGELMGLGTILVVIGEIIDLLEDEGRGGCGHFIELNVNPHFTSEFCRAQSAERQLNSLIPIPNHVRFNLLHEIL